MPISMCGTKCNHDPYAECTDAAISYVGAVLGKRERNMHDDSDFIAVVWDGSRLRDIEYGTTRFWTYHNHAEIDATPDVIDQAMCWYREQWTISAIDRTNAVAKLPTTGKTVKVTKGKHKDLVGVVGWTGIDKYKSTRYATFYRVGIKTDDEMVFVAETNVRVVNPELADESDIRSRAENLSIPNWATVIEGIAYSAISIGAIESRI